jgi:hypothetical protein
VLVGKNQKRQAEARPTESGEIMTTTSATPSWQSIGLYVQIAGAGAFIVGALLSLHHYAIGICFVTGAAAFFIGKKMRAA